MTEKVYWALAVLLAGAIIYTGALKYHPLLAGFHVLVSVLLVLVVLLQSGRAADLAGAFGGAGSQTAFGPRGAATFLSKATTFLAVVFMVTSMTLAMFATGVQEKSVAGESAPPANQQQQHQQQQTPPPPAQPPAPPQR